MYNVYRLLRAYKYRIYPNEEQRNLLSKHFGACRWEYNDALALRMKLWQDGQRRISWPELSRRLPVLKLKEETAWLSEINSQALCHQMINLDKAYRAFFENGRGFPRLSRSISDASWSEFVRQLEYKAIWYGKTVVRIGRFDPSSRLCTCGVINQNLELSDRTWTCASCGANHDRDVLAANNVKRFALGRLTPESMPVKGSRNEGTRRSRKAHEEL